MLHPAPTRARKTGKKALEAENARLRALLRDALDMFGYEFCHADGSVIINHVTGEPYSGGGHWVQAVHAALEGNDA